VLVSRGGAAREIPGSKDLPVDARVVGIIDTVNIDNQMIYDKKNQQF
jgi:carbon dioxide concentrating mechanism protein CcmL